MKLIIRVKDSELYIQYAMKDFILFIGELIKAKVYYKVEEATLDLISIQKVLTGIKIEIAEIKQEVIIHE